MTQGRALVSGAATGLPLRRAPYTAFEQRFEQQRLYGWEGLTVNRLPHRKQVRRFSRQCLLRQAAEQNR
jgi:hypothetical protein